MGLLVLPLLLLLGLLVLRAGPANRSTGNCLSNFNNYYIIEM